MDLDSVSLKGLLDENAALISYLIGRFNLEPLEELDEDADPPCLGSVDGVGDGLEFVICGTPESPFLRLVLPDFCGEYLRKFKDYEEGAFGGVETRRRFMSDSSYEPCYRILLGLQIAIEMVCELQGLQIGAAIDLRISHRNNQSDFDGFTFCQIDGEAQLVKGLLAGLTTALRPKG